MNISMVFGIWPCLLTFIVPYCAVVMNSYAKGCCYRRSSEGK